MNIWNQPGGEMWLFGGAVTVHAFALEHENSGKSVRAPMALPCVEDVAAMSDTRMVEMSPEGKSGVKSYVPPYTQSFCATVKVGWVGPLAR